MTRHGIRLRKIRGAALLLAVFAVVVMLASAYIRLKGAGLGCADWPACYGQLLTGASQLTQFGGARLLHRLTASAALLLACFLVWLCLRPQPIQPAARYAMLLLLLMLALSALGVWSSDPRRVLVGFLNIMGGLGLVVLSWRVVLATGTAALGIVVPHASVPVGPQGVLLRLGVVALAVTVMLGAWVGASYAAVSCVSVPECGGFWWPPADGWSALNPLVKLQHAAFPGDPGGLALNLLHRYGAVLTLLILGVAGGRALFHAATRSAGMVVVFLLMAEFSLGIATVVSGFSLWLAVGHNVTAAALLAAAVTLLKKY